jgi:hypothetical protein
MLPSIESAYAHGYRRMLVESIYTDVETMLKYGDEVLFFMGHYGLDATEAFLDAARGGSFNKLEKLLEKLVAAVGVGVIDVKGGVVRVGDLFIPDLTLQPASDAFGDIVEFFATHRSVRWEDELTKLLDSKQVSLAAAKKAFNRQRGTAEFFAGRIGTKAPAG